MGDPKRPRKIYATPGHPWQSTRIQEENKLLDEYGLKNKREIWKHYTQIKNYRQRARQISAMGNSEQADRLKSELFAKLLRIGVIDKKDPSLDDVLSLEINNILERRLQTIVFRKGMAHTPRQSRQFIVHGHVSLNGSRLTTPSYVVNKGEEGKITFRGTSLLAKPHPAVPKVTNALDEMKQDIAMAKGDLPGQKAEEKKPEKKEEKKEEKPEAPAQEAPKEEAKAEAPKPEAPAPETPKAEEKKPEEPKPEAPAEVKKDE